VSDVVTAAGAGAVAGLSGGMVAGMPTAPTVVCGIVGAVVSVWVSHGETFELSGKWFGKVIGLTALYFLCGLFGARGIITGGAGSDVGMIAAASKMPEWVLCGGLALAAAYLLPLVGAKLKSMLGVKHD
jgi:hypothetical protein